jgi:hypothetical protein
MTRCRYVGDFKNAMRHGEGEFHWANGDIYRGEWKEDVCDGRGMLLSANGDKYEGDFKMGVKEGQGRKVRTPNLTRFSPSSLKTRHEFPVDS